MEDYLRKQLRQNMKLSQRVQISRMSEATRLLERKQEIFEVNKALDEQKKEFRNKEDELKKREAGLREKDMKLQENLVKLSSALQDVTAKRERNEKKAAADRKKRMHDESQIERLYETIGEEKRRKESMERQLDKLMVYKSFLESVVEKTPDQFTEVFDIVQRMQTLQAAKHDLQRRIKVCDEDLESVRNKLHAFSDETGDQVLGLQNQVVQERQMHEMKTDAALDWEQECERRVKDSASLTVQYGQACMAVENLLARVLEAKPGPRKAPPSDPIEQLNIVEQYILDITDILERGNAEHSHG